MRFWSLLAWVSLPLAADILPKPLVVNAVPDIYTPISADQQKLGGLLAARMRANSEGYLEHVQEKLLLPPVSGIGSKDRVEGEQAGKFLNAAAAAYSYSHDPQLKVLMDRIAGSLVSRLSPLSPLESPEAAGQLSEREFYAIRHVLLGLISYYEVTGDERATGACKNLAAMALSPRQQAYAIVLLEPMLALYRYTGESRYLEFSRSVADSWLQTKPPADDPSGIKMRLSALIGMAQMYRISGVDGYLRAVLSGWKDLKDSLLSLTGTLSLPNGNSQTSECTNDIASDWMRLTLSLLRLTGEAQYADQAESTIYNHLFAAQNPADGRLSSSVPFDGSKNWTQVDRSCVHCEAGALAAIPGATWGRYRRGLVVYLYNPGRSTIRLRRRGTVQLFSEAAFPENGQVLLHVEPNHPLRFPVRLRVPGWAKNFFVDVGGSHLAGKPGDFLILNREWKRGDLVQINFDIPVRTIDGSPSYPDHVALRRGPELLVLEKAFNPNLENLGKAAVDLTDTADIKLAPAEIRAGQMWSGDQVYGIEGEYNGERKLLVVVPLADAVDYRLWINKANGSTAASKPN